MASLPLKVIEKLVLLIPRLSSSDERDLLTTALAIKRVLEGNGTDAHALAEHLGRAAATEELKEVYEAGIKRGIKLGKDRDFIRDVYGRAIWRRGVSTKQQDWIEDCYLKTDGVI